MNYEKKTKRGPFYETPCSTLQYHTQKECEVEVTYRLKIFINFVYFQKYFENRILNFSLKFDLFS